MRSLISIILPIKNGVEYLPTAINSILTQTYCDFEILAILDVSVNHMHLEKYTNQSVNIKVIQQNGTGIANAWNEGITAAVGTYIAFLSVDDYWMPEKLSHQVDILENKPDIDFVITSFTYFLDLHSPPNPHFRMELLNKPLVGKIMETLLVRRAVFNQVGYFNESMNAAEDLDWFLRCEDLGVKDIHIDQVLLKKRVHSYNLSLSDVNQNSRNMLKAIRNSVNRKQRATLND